MAGKRTKTKKDTEENKDPAIKTISNKTNIIKNSIIKVKDGTTNGIKKVISEIEPHPKEIIDTPTIETNIKYPKIIFEVGEEDVNWGLQEYEKCNKMTQNSLMSQMLPYAALALVSITILIIFFYFFKKFDVLAEMAASLNTAADKLAQASAGTVVVGG